MTATPFQSSASFFPGLFGLPFCARRTGGVTSVRGLSPEIVYAGQEYAFCATELASYIERMTGQRPESVDNPNVAPKASKVFVIGPPAANALTRALDKSLGRAVSAALVSPQAIVVWPVQQGRTRYVVLAGSDPVTTLYATYAYLESCCRVGFFQDGEFVPKGRLPFGGRPIVSVPRFLDRKGPMNLGGGHWGLKKFYERFWTLDELKRDLLWMARRRMNMAFAPMGIGQGLADEAIRETCADLGYPLDRVKEEMLAVSGFPVSWSWPPAMRAAMAREALAYGRRLGIRFIYSLAPGQVPPEFRRKYPDLRYLKTDRWEHAEIHPDDPFFEKYTACYLNKIVDTFGTDHLYCANPYAETSPEGTPEENFGLKKNAALRFLRLLKKVDPMAVWVTDSWDFFWSRETWTAERVKAYLDAIPTEACFIYDTNADNRGVPTFQQHACFHGKSWAFGVMHSAAGLDQIHGDFAHLLSLMQRAAVEPQAARCRGVFLVPELTHHNVMYYDFLTRASWDPRTMDLDAFLDDFAERRYGERSAKAMRRVLDHVVAALYTRELNTPVHNLATLKWIWQNVPPWMQHHTIPRLHRAVRRALKERRKQRNNPLYENDILNLTKAFIAELAAWHFHRANAAYAAADRDGLDREEGRCLEAVEWIARILSTRPDCSLAEMIADVMKVPGTNCHTPRMILQGVVNWDYCSNDSYEQVANYDLPRMRNYFALLRTRLDEGHPAIDLWKTVETLTPAQQEWTTSDATLRRTVVFDGKPFEAMTRALDVCSAAVPKSLLAGRPLRRGRTVGWHDGLSRAARWEVGEPGARIKGKVISSDPAYGPMGHSMHREWVDMPLWGTVRTSASAGLSGVDLHRTPLLTIRYCIEAGEDPLHLWVNWKGTSGTTRRTRVWRSFAPVGEWRSDTVDLLHSLRSRGEEPQELLSLEFGTQRPPQAVRIRSLEISN